jgi:hypothetical protein
MYVIVGLFTLGLVLCLFLPETLERSKLSSLSTENNYNPDHHQSIRSKIIHAFGNIRDSLSIFESYLIFGLSIAFLLQTLHGYSLDILFQLASARFHWSLAEVSSAHNSFSLLLANKHQRQASSSQSHPSQPS